MVTRRRLMTGALTSALGVAAAPAPAFAMRETLDSQGVHRGRATVPVSLNGVATFQFMVDTAANASVIADDLLPRLQLTSEGMIGMHTLVGREVVPIARMDRMQSGALDARDVRLAVGSRRAMGGLDGLLGCDLLVDGKVILNFQGRARARIGRSGSPPRGFHAGHTPGIPLVVTGERRFGNLLMVRALTGRAPVIAIIDSGAEGTILNTAAARAGNALPLTPRDGQDVRRIESPTGEVTTGQAMLLPSLGIAGLSVFNVAVAVGDFHSFDVWGLGDRPAMLIGLDVLGLFKAVHIDLRRSELSLHV